MTDSSDTPTPTREAFDCSQTSVARIVHRKTWEHVP